MKRHAGLGGANTPQLLINAKKRRLAHGLCSAKTIWRGAD
jgi:hypothetical protein